MPEKRVFNNKTYIVSNTSQISFTAAEWEVGKRRYRKQVASKLADSMTA